MDERKPLISIIIPNYNYGRYLREAIDSALSQAYNNIEVIVVDDGSTDNSKDIIATYKKHIHSIYLSQNKGLGGARNAGLKEAKGDYILLLDSDDWLFSEAVDGLVDGFKNHPACGVIFGNAEYVNSAGVFGAFHINRDRAFPYEEFLFENPILVSEALIRTHVLNAVGGFNSDPSIMSVADYDLWIRISKQYRVSHISHKITAIRKHEDSMSGSNIPHLTQEFQMKLRHADGTWLTRKALAEVCHRLAYEYKIAKQPALFRQYAWKAMRYNPAYWKNYAYLASSFVRECFARSKVLGEKA